MKLKCNVCHNGSIIELTGTPRNIDDLICCNNCDKQMAYATEKKYSNKLVWKPIDTEFNKEAGFIPVQIIN